MNDDKELLELAAKAAQMDAIVWTSGAWTFGEKTECRPGSADIWNPLTDDGDALRLALRLEMTLRPYTSLSRAKYCEVELEHEGRQLLLTEKVSTTLEEATRRAIVRAAAIGEQMK